VHYKQKPSQNQQMVFKAQLIELINKLFRIRLESVLLGKQKGNRPPIEREGFFSYNIYTLS